MKPGDWYFYDEQFRYIRQSAPDLYPWDIIHWELWLKAVLHFRAKSHLPSEKVSAGVFSRSRSRPSFPKGTCWTFHAGRYCSGCRFEHVCFKCGSKDPASQCSANQHQQRSALPKNGAVTSNSTQQAGHAFKLSQERMSSGSLVHSSGAETAKALKHNLNDYNTTLLLSVPTLSMVTM